MVTTPVQISFQAWRVLLLSCCLLLPTLSKAEMVEDLSYGVGLYHFFQKQYFSAITEIMVAEDQSTLTHHENTAKLLKGGMSLSYGLDRNAEAIFNDMLHPDQLTEKINLTKQQKNKAWLYLAKIIYQQGDYSRAITAFNFVENKTENNSDQWPMIDEGNYLQATMLLKQHKEKSAQILMRKIAKNSIYWPYYYYNLGSLYSSKNQWKLAIEAFELCNEAMLDKTQEQVLRDRANTAAGYAYLSLQQYPKAVKAFQRININSPLIDNALLGYGWALTEQQKFVAALAPWQALQQRSLLLPSVQEVFLALPYVYEKLDNVNIALSEYESAALAYRKEISSIDEAITFYQQKDLADLIGFDLLEAELNDNEELIVDKKNAYYLGHLIGQHRFQSKLKDYRSLLILNKNLTSSQKKVKLLTLVNNEQQQYWLELIKTNRFQILVEKKRALVEERDAIERKIKLAESDKTGQQLVNGNDKELWQLIYRAKLNAEELRGRDTDVDYELEQLQRYEGILLWKSSEDYVDNHWKIKRQIKQLNSAIESTDSAFLIVKQVIDEKTESQFSPRLDAVKNTLVLEQQRVDTALSEVERNIRSLTVDDLASQKNQLKVYLARATLLIARLYDLGNEQAAKRGFPNE